MIRNKQQTIIISKLEPGLARANRNTIHPSCWGNDPKNRINMVMVSSDNCRSSLD